MSPEELCYTNMYKPKKERVMDKRSSFTSADAVPLKLLYHQDVHDFKPIHIQWIPTNSCNLNCPQCSCAQRDKSLCMNLAESYGVIANFASMGTKAVTITGGGEPLTHPYIEGMIHDFWFHGIKIGLVTNGLLLNKLSKETLERITWCRISSMDHRTFDDSYQEILRRAIDSSVDWAFSHVVSAEPNIPLIKNLVNFANHNAFTHVRLVADLLDVNSVDTTFTVIREALQDIDDKIIYQPRNNPVCCTECMIGYVKPLVAPDFRMYLCCGVQYALKEQALDLPDELCMGSAKDLDLVYKTIRPFRTKCVSCYYTGYNNILNSLFDGLEHKEFV